MDTNAQAGSFRLVFGFCYGYWRRQGLLVPAALAAMTLATVADALIPLLAGDLVDLLAAASGGFDGALRAVALIAALALTVTFFRYLAFTALVKSSTRAMGDLVDDAFYRVQRFSTDWHASSFTGATVRKITRGMWAFDSLADTLLLGLLPAAVVLASVTLMLGAHWALMGLLVAAGIILFVGLSLALVIWFLAPATRLSIESDSRIGATIADSIDGNAVVKSFAREPEEDERLREVTSTWKARTTRSWTRFNLAGLTQGVYMSGLQAAVLGLAVVLWARGLATPGDVVYVLTTYSLIHAYLRDIGHQIRMTQRAVNDMEDVARFARLPLGVADRPGARALVWTGGHVEFRAITFRYAGQEQPLYRDFSLDLRAGECVGLVGASGSGKSTFVKLIQRLYDIEAGQILIDGQDIAGVTQASLRRQIAVVPQEPALFHRTLAENIAYGRPGATPADIEQAARQARAHDFIAVLPLGYETEVGERGVKLSGGERQRVAMARAVLADARILILDEATSSLDSVSETLMQRAIESVIEGRTTIIIAHRLSTIQRVDRILVFDRGRIVEQGTHHDLLRRPDGHYRRLYQSQALGLVGEQGMPVEAA